MNVIHGNIAETSKDLATAPERYMVVTDSLKSKLPPTLVIKSANLRVLDPIGQGIHFIICSYSPTQFRTCNNACKQSHLTGHNVSRPTQNPLKRYTFLTHISLSFSCSHHENYLRLAWIPA